MADLERNGVNGGCGPAWKAYDVGRLLVRLDVLDDGLKGFEGW